MFGLFDLDQEEVELSVFSVCQDEAETARHCTVSCAQQLSSPQHPRTPNSDPKVSEILWDSLMSDQDPDTPSDPSPYKDYPSFQRFTSEFQCTICFKQCKGLKGLRQHAAKVHIRAPKEAPCPHCSKLFRDKYAVNFHVKQVHHRATRVICEECGKVAYNKYALAKHVCILRN